MRTCRPTLAIVGVLALILTVPVLLPARAQTPDDAVYVRTPQDEKPPITPVEVGRPGRPELRDYKATPSVIRTEIILPGTPVEQTVEGFFRGRIDDLAHHIEIIYTWLMGVVGLLAGTMLVVGGFQYLTAGGDKGRVQAAQGRMMNAMIGMVLAFSAYFLLNTINPALVNFKVPTVAQVKTEAAIVPACEDINALRGQGTVRPLAAQGCGNIGEFKAGGETHYCLYSGDCRLKSATLPDVLLCNKRRWHFSSNCEKETGGLYLATCMNYNVLPDQLKEAAANQPSKVFGQCLTCAELNPAKLAQMGFKDAEAACGRWQDIANSAPRLNRTLSKASEEDQLRYPLGSIWSYCDTTKDAKRCFQADVYCTLVDDNFSVNIDSSALSDPIGGSFSIISSAVSGDFDNIVETAPDACGGYESRVTPAVADPEDDASLTPTILSLVSNTETFAQTAGAVFTDTWNLQQFPKHLAGVCSWNPCRFNVPQGHGLYTAGYGGCGYDKLVRFASIKYLRFKEAECSNVSKLPTEKE